MKYNFYTFPIVYTNYNLIAASFKHTVPQQALNEGGNSFSQVARSCKEDGPRAYCALRTYISVYDYNTTIYAFCILVAAPQEGQFEYWTHDHDPSCQIRTRGCLES